MRNNPSRSTVRKGPSRLHILIGVLGCVGVLMAVAVFVGTGFVIYRLLGPSPSPWPPQTEDYVEARKHFKTKLVRMGPAAQRADPFDLPPEAKRIDYKSGGLLLRAFANRMPGAHGRPGVLFLHGGFAMGDDDWDQAEPFRDAGFIVLMPMLRGENHQPGFYSLFYDEVEDALAAAETLAQLPEVDPKRVFVSGHSAGGTLALLAAMTSTRFRACASFSGSPDQIAFVRGQLSLAPFNLTDPREFQMRSPLAFPKSFKCPVRLYYGSQESFFRGSSQRLAISASDAGLDVKAVSVSGDHMSHVPESMEQAIEFFKQIAPD
jgi:dienelactone hydrolase